MQLKSIIAQVHRLKSLEWFSFLFTIFAVILFAVAVFLNHSYHVSSLKSIKAELMEKLQKSSSALKLAIQDTEKAIIERSDEDSITPNELLDATIYKIIDSKLNEYCQPDADEEIRIWTQINKAIMSGDYANAAQLEKALFVNYPPLPGPLNETSLNRYIAVPIFLNSFFHPAIDQLSGRESFAEALKLLGANKASAAKKHFAAAGLICPQNNVNRQIAIWSHLNLLTWDKPDDQRRLYYILYLAFEIPGELSSDMLSYVETALRDKFIDYNKHKMHSKAIWSLSEKLKQKEGDNIRPLRMMLDGKIVSTVYTGNILAFKVDWNSYLPESPDIRLSKDNGFQSGISLELPLEFLPGYKFSVSRKTFDTKSRSINRQYHVINGLLGLLLILMALFTLGTARLIREENDLARLRSRFVATVSHELRTPISLIQLYSETLFENRINSSKKNEYLQTIVAETQRLSGLVNNVIDFSRLEGGIRTFNYSDSNISELSWNVIQEFKYRLNLEGFRINAKIHPDVKARIDPQAFCRILFNLLDNAIKYSEKDKYIALDLSQTADSVVLKVTDHGIGIPADAKPFVYLDYYRVDDPRVASQRGSGIGLSVVKQLLDSMNAAITMEDTAPHGTMFTVTIPRENKKATTEITEG